MMSGGFRDFRGVHECQTLRQKCRKVLLMKVGNSCPTLTNSTTCK